MSAVDVGRPCLCFRETDVQLETSSALQHGQDAEVGEWEAKTDREEELINHCEGQS